MKNKKEIYKKIYMDIFGLNILNIKIDDVVLMNIMLDTVLKDTSMNEESFKRLCIFTKKNNPMENL